MVLEVDLEFADRYERQRIGLVEQAGGWAIASITASELVRPPVSYGTPVYEEPATTKDRPK